MVIYVDQADLPGGYSNDDLVHASQVSLDLFTVAQPPVFGVADPAAPTVSIQGMLNFAFEVDVFEFEVLPEDVGNVTLTFDIDNSTGGLDTIIGLFDPVGTVVAGNDNYGVVFSPDTGSTTISDSYTTYIPTVAGIYHIAVAAFGNKWPGGVAGGGLSTGTYTLNVSISGAVGVQSYGNGSSGSDSLFGDRLGVATNDQLDGYAGNDDITGDAGADTLFGGDGRDALYGGIGGDAIFGDGLITDTPEEGAGDEDLIYGGDDNDFAYGGRGNDTVYGGAGQDRLVAGSGNDKVLGDAGDDMLWGDDGLDSMYGGTGNDTLYGGADLNALFGGAGNDSLHGGDGGNRLNGGVGQDTLVAGMGIDTFVFAAVTDSRRSLKLCDVITQFSTIGQDRIDLRAIDANSIGGGANDAFSHVILRSGVFTAPGQIRAKQVGADTIIYLNTDADTAPESVIRLVNVIEFTVTDPNFLF